MQYWILFPNSLNFLVKNWWKSPRNTSEKKKAEALEQEVKHPWCVTSWKGRGGEKKEKKKWNVPKGKPKFPREKEIQMSQITSKGSGTVTQKKEAQQEVERPWKPKKWENINRKQEVVQAELEARQKRRRRRSDAVLRLRELQLRRKETRKGKKKYKQEMMSRCSGFSSRAGSRSDIHPTLDVKASRCRRVPVNAALITALAILQKSGAAFSLFPSHLHNFIHIVCWSTTTFSSGHISFENFVLKKK